MTAPKPPLSIPDQVSLLASRGLHLDRADQATLSRLLADNSFSRLAPYWRDLQTDPATGDKTFKPGASLAQIIDVYEFDAQLRRLLAQGLETFEVALRARLGQDMAMNGFAYTYLDPASYTTPASKGRPVDARQDLFDAMTRELDRTKEQQIVRYTSIGQTPPLWAAMGVFTLGTISKMYRLLDHSAIRLGVARSFGYPNPRFAENTFHSLSVLRNITAHHSRIWGRADIQYAPPVLKRLQTDPDKSIYQRTPWAWITIVADLADTIRGDHTYSNMATSHSTKGGQPFRWVYNCGSRAISRASVSGSSMAATGCQPVGPKTIPMFAQSSGCSSACTPKTLRLTTTSSRYLATGGRFCLPLTWSTRRFPWPVSRLMVTWGSPRWSRRLNRRKSPAWTAWA